MQLRVKKQNEKIKKNQQQQKNYHINTPWGTKKESKKVLKQNETNKNNPMKSETPKQNQEKQ